MLDKVSMNYKIMFKKFLNILSKHYPFFLFVLFPVFIFLKWPDLFLPIWGDEMSYAPHHLWTMKNGWSFFLPWNYNPLSFMGHPFLHPLILYTAFSVFGPSVFIAKVVSLFLSLFFLVTFYKMTELVFKCSVTAFYSTVFTMFLPYFWVYSSLILADISTAAFGFGTIYTFIARKYKSLLLFSLGLGVIRESSLAFFVPLLLYGLIIPSQRKSLLYLLPGLFIFISHFLIFFLKTGAWIAHPYISGTLSHNPNPVFFDFSIILVNIQQHFSPLILNTYPLVFFITAGGAFIGYIAMLFFEKKEISLGKEIFIPLSMCVLWFLFWIMYPDQTERNYFPLLMFLIPLGIYFVVKTVLCFHVFLIVLCTVLVTQTVYRKSYVHPLNFMDYSQTDILDAKAFISYFDEVYARKIRNSEKMVFFTWPGNVLLSFPEYEYIEDSMNANSDCQLSEKKDIERYGAIIFWDITYVCIPFYKLVKTSDSFTQIKTPFEAYRVFIHKDFL